MLILRGLINGQMRARPCGQYNDILASNPHLIPTSPRGGCGGVGGWGGVGGGGGGGGGVGVGGGGGGGGGVGVGAKNILYEKVGEMQDLKSMVV